MSLRSRCRRFRYLLDPSAIPPLHGALIDRSVSPRAECRRIKIQIMRRKLARPHRRNRSAGIYRGIILTFHFPRYVDRVIRPHPRRAGPRLNYSYRICRRQFVRRAISLSPRYRCNRRLSGIRLTRNLPWQRRSSYPPRLQIFTFMITIVRADFHCSLFWFRFVVEIWFRVCGIFQCNGSHW